jgi:LDH2 family malate/lactate/ureidoglycolate dehydrogenase
MMKTPVADSAVSPTVRYSVQDLSALAQQLLERCGLNAEKAAVVAEILVEGDLLGHTTHGMQALPSLLKALKTKEMSSSGEPVVLSDKGSAIVWDGQYLPGPWLVVKALNQCFDRMADHPVVTLVIRRSHLIGCLCAYLSRATSRGFMITLMSSNPSRRTVAPFGAMTPAYTPDPLAVGIPTEHDPILIDISMSCTSNLSVERFKASGKKLPGSWLLDGMGRPSDDPSVMSGNPPGSILPLGGADLGYKGFGLALMIEAMTAALGGYGRSDKPAQPGAAVYLQITNPAAFGGIDEFKRETEYLANACRGSTPRPGFSEVRMPGGHALAQRAEQLKLGVALYPTIMPEIKPWTEQLGVLLPQPLKS